MELYGDYVQEACAASGTADYTLSGPPGSSPYTGAVANFGTGQRVAYVVISDVTFKYEIGWGIVTDGSPDTLTRNVKRSWDGVTLSNSAKINWSGADGALRMFCAPAAWVINGAVTHHRSGAAPDAPIAGMTWEDITSLAAVVRKHYDGAGWIAEPWTRNETTDKFVFADPTVDGDPANKNYVDDNDYATPRCRLTLATGTAVTTADQTAKTTIYLTPFEGRRLPIPYGAGVWVKWEFSEISLALDSNSGHTGYQQSGKAFDVWAWDKSGVLTLGTGAAWTNDTTPADVAVLDNGRWTNNASITLRFGTNSGDTVAVAAKNALWVGTIYCTANGQTEDSLVKRFCWNVYNRRPRPMRRVDTTDSWSYNTATIRQANNAAANQLDFIRGLDEDAVEATVITRWANDSAGQAGFNMIGLDSTTAAAAEAIAASNSAGAANQNCVSVARWSGCPGRGRHFLTWLERGTGSGTQTFYGDQGVAYVQSGLHGMVMA